jgi:fructose transport system substrate-binding protein
MTLSTIQWLRSSKASAAAVAAALLVTVACSSSASAEGPKVALLVAAETNPYFKKMADAAKAEAAKDGVDLAITSNKVGDSDEVQSNAIETAVASGVSTILINPAGPGIVPAIRKARAAGVMVLALDNPTTPADAVDMAYVTSNRDAGRGLGKYVAAKLNGAPAVIAMLDVFEGKVIQVDIDRDHGFLTGMGIPETNPNINGAEPKTGKYAGGGDYTVVCHQATQAAEDGGRTAMENCLTKNPDINVVYTINEPAAFGAFKALQAAGKTQGVTIATFDGSCSGMAAMKKGVISVDAQTYPARMAELGIQAAVAYAKDKSIPKPSPGLNYFNPGIALVTDTPVAGINSISSDDGGKSCF